MIKETRHNHERDGKTTDNTRLNPAEKEQAGI
jgi:hypothetical protein